MKRFDIQKVANGFHELNVKPAPGSPLSYDSDRNVLCGCAIGVAALQSSCSLPPFTNDMAFKTLLEDRGYSFSYVCGVTLGFDRVFARGLLVGTNDPLHDKEWFIGLDDGVKIAWRVRPDLEEAWRQLY